MTYTVEYFLTKFGAIEEDQWCEGAYEDGAGQHCALGLCGAKHSDIGPTTFPEEARALDNLLKRELGISPSMLNDGHSIHFRQPTPKQRILAGLEEIKNQSK